MGPTKMDGYCWTPTHRLFTDGSPLRVFIESSREQCTYSISSQSDALLSRHEKTTLLLKEFTLILPGKPCITHRTNTPVIQPTTYEWYFTQSVNQLKDITLLPFLVLKHAVTEQDTN